MPDRNNKGYSLIELLIAIQIFMIIVTMVYTVYLIGYRYISQWNRENDLIRTELMVQKAIMSRLHQAKKLIEINQNGLLLINRWYQPQQIRWDGQSVWIDSMQVTARDIRAEVKQLMFLHKDRQNMYHIKSFADLDLNGDDKLTGPELNEINSIKFHLKFMIKRSIRTSILNFILPPHPNIKIEKSFR
jgi:type II secretory pathway pseudopilin PulG